MAPTPHPSHFPGEKTVECLITRGRKVEFLFKDSKESEIVDAQSGISFIVALGREISVKWLAPDTTIRELLT